MAWGPDIDRVASICKYLVCYVGPLVAVPATVALGPDPGWLVGTVVAWAYGLAVWYNRADIRRYDESTLHGARVTVYPFPVGQPTSHYEWHYLLPVDVARVAGLVGLLYAYAAAPLPRNYVTVMLGTCLFCGVPAYIAYVAAHYDGRTVRDELRPT